VVKTAFAKTFHILDLIEEAPHVMEAVEKGWPVLEGREAIALEDGEFTNSLRMKVRFTFVSCSSSPFHLKMERSQLVLK
jgi:hypothetical protein